MEREISCIIKLLTFTKWCESNQFSDIQKSGNFMGSDGAQPVLKPILHISLVGPSWRVRCISVKLLVFCPRNGRPPNPGLAQLSNKLEHEMVDFIDFHKRHLENTRSVWPQLESPPHIHQNPRLSQKPLATPWIDGSFGKRHATAWDTFSYIVANGTVSLTALDWSLWQVWVIPVMSSGNISSHLWGTLKHIICLVVEPTPLKNMSSSVRQLGWWNSQLNGKSSKCSKAPVLQDWS